MKSEKKEKEKVKVQVKKRKEKGISISALLLIKDFFAKALTDVPNMRAPYKEMVLLFPYQSCVFKYVVGVLP